MRKLFTVIGLCFLATIASAGSLQIVDVSSPDILCFFSTNCANNGTNFDTQFGIPQTLGAGRLTSRLIIGQPGSPLAGYGAYIYNVDAAGIKSMGSIEAVINSISIPFSKEIIARDYSHTGMTNSQIWNITKGGGGSVRVSAANSGGTNLTFIFDPPIRCADSNHMGEASFFFGVVSTNRSRAIYGRITATVGTNQTSCLVSNTSPVYY
jgi:hypothetical protein